LYFYIFNQQRFRADTATIPALQQALPVVCKFYSSKIERREFNMKFKIYFSVFLFFIIVKSSGQTALDTDGLNNLDNIYLYSLKEYCKSLDSSKTKIVYVRRDYFIGENWPKKIKTFEIEYLKSSEYKKVILANGGITLVGISPLHFIKGDFYVDVIPFEGTYKKKIVNLSNGGGLSVYFEYDPVKKALVFKSEEWSLL
jgi:hypothetical protein